MDHNKLWKILQERGTPDHLTCLLRNLYAGQEATVRTGRWTTDGFQWGKEYVKAVHRHPAYSTYMQSKVAQSCLTLCDPMDCSPPGSSIHGILQARILEWVAISFSRGSSRPRDQTQVSRIAADALTSEPPGKQSRYAEYIMWNARLYEAGIKTVRRNIYNLRYADDTTLMAESKELKSLLMKVKEERVKKLT